MQTQSYKHNTYMTHRGFTLVEVMIVVAILGVLAAIAYPNYRQYGMDTKRAEMMSEMHIIASEIQARKLAQGKYSDTIKAGLIGDYPKQGAALYAVTITPIPLTSQWKITATPKPNEQMAGDGILTLDYNGLKCLDNICGTATEWSD